MMLVNYQITGKKKDRICVSMFEFDEIQSRIVPENLIIITQQLTTSAAKLSFSSHDTIKSIKSPVSINKQP